MIDIDKNKIDIENRDNLTDEYIIKYFKQKKESFRIYKSINGYHVFCTSKKFKYRDVNSVQFMLDNMCDKYYCLYSYLRGFCVRLNKKFDEISTDPNYKIYKLIAVINEKNELPEQKKKLQLLDRLIHKYKKECNLNPCYKNQIEG
jgi:hypothetical protein